MADEAGKFIKFLDQLIPFLETFPTWFKVWIYILIFIVFLTLAGMAVFYLVGKENVRTKKSLKYFSVERPKDKEEIPLSASETWMINGLFPVIDENKKAEVNVEVIKMPEKQSIPQSGAVRISTVEGVWTYEYIKFAGEGAYDIVVTGILDSQSVFRRVNVVCTEKAKAYSNNINIDREFRGVQKITFALREEISLPALQQKLYQMQQDFFTEFPANLQKSLEIVSKTFDLVDKALPLYPNDLYLQNVRAYSFKNYAMVMERMNSISEFERALNESEKMFEAILEQDKNNAGAWNGLGSVSALSRNPHRALYFINRALEIDPNYEEALHDRKIVVSMIEEEKRMKNK
jgi:hypothetical protein